MTSLTRRHIVMAGSTAAFAPAALAAKPATPAPFGAVPSPRQLAWHRLETYGFLHFTVNTFTDREWGLGDEDPKIFNPTDFDADQIVAGCRAGGLKQLILTAKHHDGFCLWPSRYTEHSVKNSPLQGGHGDVVRDISRACARQGLTFGVYLSPWDRNHAEYGRPAYVEYYLNQLHELLTGYGPIHEVWFDGANGGDGYYGGAREVRRIDAATYYQWDRIRQTVRALQPDAVMFADAHMDVRWVGNEDGIAGDPCWPTWDASPYSLTKANSGVRGGPAWDPAEVDVSIRPGWFWHADEDDKVRSPANLMNLYLCSTGRGANLLLNVPPNRRGRIGDSDVRNLKAFRDILDRTYAHNLAAGATVTASSTFSPAYAPARVLDGKGSGAGKGSWAARADDRDGAWLQLDLPQPRTFDFIRLREDLPFGVRVDDFELDVWRDGWTPVARHSAIGSQRLIRLDTPVTARKVRLRFTRAAASPVIAEFSLYRLPDLVEEPMIQRDPAGLVTLRPATAGDRIVYTLDGSAPDASSPVYSQPIPLPDGGTVRALAIKPASGALSEVTRRDFDVAPGRWTVVGANGDAPAGLLNGDGFRGNPGKPVDIVIDLAQAYPLKGFTLTPLTSRVLGVAMAREIGPPAGFTAWVSADGTNWGEPAATGEFSNIAASRAEQTIGFTAPHPGRYLRLHLPRAVQDKPIIAVGGIGILTR